MAVFKRLNCKACGKRSQAPKEERTPPACPQCGEIMTYSKKWYITVYLPTTNGGKKPHTEAVSTKKSDAELEESKYKVYRSKGGKISATNPIMNQAFDEFISYLEMQVIEGKIAESTKVYYEKRVNTNLRPSFGKIKLKDFGMKAEDLADQYKKKRIGAVKPATLNREIATLKRFCTFAKKKKLLPSNPLIGYELLTENNERDRVLTEEEIARLLAECKAPHLKLAVKIALATGLRREGVLTLKWNEIDWMRNEIRKVVKHHRRRGTKRVDIPLTIKLRDELLSWRKEQAVQSIGGYVIPSPRNPADHIKVSSDFGFASACIRAGIDVYEEWSEKKQKMVKKTEFHFHDLRHCFATYFLKATKNLHALAEILGHSPQEEYRMSRRYAHILREEKHEAMKQFEGEE